MSWGKIKTMIEEEEKEMKKKDELKNSSRQIRKWLAQVWKKLSKTCLQLLNKTTKTETKNAIKCYKEQINPTKYVEEIPHNEKNKKLWKRL